MDQVPEQRKSEKYICAAHAFNFIARGNDKVTMTMGHEEIDSIQPFKTIYVIDATFTLSPMDARNMANILNKNADAILGENIERK